MFSRLKNLKLLILFLLLCVVLFFIYLLPVHLAPYLLQDVILPKLSGRSGYDMRCEIRRAGLFTLSANDFSLSRAGQGIVEIDHISLEYTFFGLGGIREIRIIGLTVDAGRIKRDVPKGGEGADGFISSLSSSLKVLKNFIPSKISSYMRESGFAGFFEDTTVAIRGGKYYFTNGSGEAKIFPFELCFRFSASGSGGISNLKFESKLFSGDKLISCSMDAIDGKGLFSVGIRIPEPVPISVEIDDGKIAFLGDKIEIDALSNIKLFYPEDDNQIDFEDIQLSIAGQLSNELITLKCAMVEPVKFFINLNDHKTTGRLSKLALDAQFIEELSLVFSCAVTDIDSDLKGGTLRIPEIALTCEIMNDQIEGIAKIANASYSRGAIELSEIGVVAKTNNFYKVEIGGGVEKINFAGAEYGNVFLNGAFDLSKKRLELRGDYSMPSIDYRLPVSVLCSLESRDKVFKISARNEDYVVLKKIPLSSFANVLDGFTAEGELKLDYFFEYRDATIKSRFEKSFRNFCIENPAMGISLTGLEGAFISADPALMKSLPEMKMRADKFVVGKNNFENIDLTYALESPKSFYVERLSADWCGGNLYIFSTRFDDTEKKKITLYFDRVLLSDKLAKIGIFEASGEGRISGKIPLVIDGQNIEFKDAFFHSIPGVGGNIRVQRSAAIAGALPVGDIGQSSPVDLTLEALKDFNYDWSKISLNTDGDELVAKIEFLGRPSAPLPFHFNHQTGAFSRVEVDMPGSVFTEIKFDLNCRLPFNAITRYINAFRELLKGKEVK